MKNKIVYFNSDFGTKLLYRFGCNVIYIPENVQDIKEYLMSLEYNDYLYEKGQFILKNWDNHLIL
jgi:hypothetical protein